MMNINKVTFETEEGYKVTITAPRFEEAESKKRKQRREEFEAKIIASLSKDEYKDVCSMDVWAVEEYSHQKITACIKPLVIAGIVDRKKIAGKIVYRLI